MYIGQILFILLAIGAVLYFLIIIISSEMHWRNWEKKNQEPHSKIDDIKNSSKPLKKELQRPHKRSKKQ